MKQRINPLYFTPRKRSAPIILVVLSLLLLTPFTQSAEPVTETPGEYSLFQPEGDIRRFNGETLSYDISFLWFDKAANATVSFYKKSDHYEALLIAETKGVVGWFTAYRKHIYRATFDILEGNKRLRSNKFEREVVIGDTKDRTVHKMDYTARTHTWVATKNGDEVKGSEEIPPDENFDDILTAFYNFRNSVYGKLVKGASFKIHTIPEKGVHELSVYIKTEKEEEEIRTAMGRKKADELLLNVIIPKEIFKTKTGELLFWSSKHYVPLSTTVVEYILLGDLHANFVKRTIEKSLVPTADIPR